MHTARTPRTRAATVLVAALSMLMAFAVPASASDVRLPSVSAVCDQGEPVGLAYTAQLVDRLDETTTATALIEYKPSSLDDDAYTAIDSLELNEGNSFTNSGSASGLDFGGEDEATVRVTITASDNVASDRDGRDKVTGDQYVVSADLTTCQPVEETPDPTAVISGECTSTGGAVSVGVDNPGDEAVTYVVTVDGEVVDTFDVTNDSETRDYPLEDGTYDVVVTADGETVASETVEIECEATPSAAAVGGCLDTGVIEVELLNPDPTAATFVVSIDGEVVDTIVVADAIESIVYAVGEGIHDVLITADGETILDAPIEVFCDGEVFQLTFEVGCDEGVGVFAATLSNDGPATTAQVLVDGEIVADVDVAADSISTFAVELPAGLPQVVVISDGVTILDAPIEVDCVEGETEQPDPIVTNECQVPANGVYTVTLENPGTEPVDVTVTMTDTDGFTAVDETLTLAGDETSTVNAPLDNGTYVLNVTADGTTIVDETVDVDCTAVQGITETPDDLGGAPAGQPTELPATGATTVAWMLLALLLMFFGADVLLSGELRRRLAMMRA